MIFIDWAIAKIDSSRDSNEEALAADDGRALPRPVPDVCRRVEHPTDDAAADADREDRRACHVIRVGLASRWRAQAHGVRIDSHRERAVRRWASGTPSSHRVWR